MKVTTERKEGADWAKALKTDPDDPQLPVEPGSGMWAPIIQPGSNRLKPITPILGGRGAAFNQGAHQPIHSTGRTGFGTQDSVWAFGQSRRQ